MFIAALSTSSLSSPNPDAAVTQKVLQILTSRNESIPKILSTYFRNINTWLPIISQDKLYERLKEIHSKPSSGLATLLLSIHLITQMPSHDAADSIMQTPIYFKAKALLNALLASGHTTLEMVQACTLLCLYECGHGMIGTANISMAVCARLGWNLISHHVLDTSVQDTEEGRLWWGIVILDT